MNNIIEKFNFIAEKANNVLNETFDCQQAEPFYIEILKLIKENPSYRNQFIDAFLSILNNKNAPWELVQFCMRELQWIEIKKSIETKLDNELKDRYDWRIISVLRHILEVYEEEWSDEDLYEYYRKK